LICSPARVKSHVTIDRFEIGRPASERNLPNAFLIYLYHSIKPVVFWSIISNIIIINSLFEFVAAAIIRIHKVRCGMPFLKDKGVCFLPD
jgi:hypothetical protein